MTLIVNGKHRELDPEPHRSLAGALREELGLTGAHLGCPDGTCGACTVLVDGEPTRSCLMLAVQCEGARLRTVEGLAHDHPARAAVSDAITAQCDLCRPGLVMLAAGAMQADPGLVDDPERLHRLLASNVCRCDGLDTTRNPIPRSRGQRSG